MYVCIHIYNYTCTYVCTYAFIVGNAKGGFKARLDLGVQQLSLLSHSSSINPTVFFFVLRESILAAPDLDRP